MKPKISGVRVLRIVLFFLLCVTEFCAPAQIMVSLAGITNKFDTLPVGSQWSGRSAPGSSSDLITTAEVDWHANTNIAANVTNSLIAVIGDPPAANSPGPVWSTNGYLQTRPAGVQYMLLMATLRNASGVPLSFLEVSYDFTFVNFGPAEEVPGHRVFYSLTGEAFDWHIIPSLSGNTSSERTSVVLSFTSWAPNAPLYLLWVDDNSASGVDLPLQIDNFAARPLLLFPVITEQPASQAVLPNESVTFQVRADGYAPLSYQWFKNGASISGATGTTYTIASAQLSDVGLYSVRVSNAYNWTVSADAFLAIGCFANLAFTTQPQSQGVPAGGTISLGATVSGTAPFAFQWHRNGVPIPGATNATYVRGNAAAADTGYYHLVVTSCGHSVASISAAVGVGRPPVSLFGWTNQLWRYEQSGIDMGFSWREPAFNDSSWAVGRGVLANDNHPVVVALTNTVLARTNSTGTIITHYFRTHFTLTNEPHEVLLVASNLIDDGCVVYLNGKEAYRINMPGGSVSGATLASQSAVEGQFITANLPSSLLMVGNNLLAAEVHQLNAAHDDVVFGLGLTTTFPPPAPLVITNQPTSLTLQETRTGTFIAGVQGHPAHFQWHRNGLPIPNATTNPLVIPSVSTNDTGSYFAVITNRFNAVTSAVALLTVSRDSNGPVIVEADGGTTPTNVLVTFSEALSEATATNVGYYRITNTLGASLTVTRASLQNGTNVLLTTSQPRLVGFNYLLTVNNVRDVSPQSNVIVTNSQRPVRRSMSLISFDSFWRFYDPFASLEPADLGTSWKEFTYIETNFWTVNRGVFFGGDDERAVPEMANTRLDQTDAVTTYFRTGFDLPASRGGLQVMATHIIDDGGILYLNGREVLRRNMPAGPVNYQTLPLTALETIPRVGPLPIDESAMRSGSNVVAFELHQVMPIDVDKVFGLQLDASVQSYVTGGVFITGGPEDVTITEGAAATFSVVQAGGATFSWQQNSNAIPGATNATLVIPAVPLILNGTRFRMFSSNSTSWNYTTNAMLRVLPDLTPPVLLSAVGSADNQVLLSFSETLEAALAGAISNYTAVNAAGEPLTITSATLTNGTNVLLAFATSSAGATEVMVRNLRDNSTAHNVIAHNTSASVGVDHPMAKPPVVRPYLSAHQLGQFKFLHWSGSGFVLECANGISGPWTSLPGGPPHVISVTNAASFYRLRQ